LIDLDMDAGPAKLVRAWSRGARRSDARECAAADRQRGGDDRRLSAHGAPRTAEVLRRLQRQAWAIEAADSDAATQTERWPTARFADLEQARAAARPYHGRVNDLMRWAPADRPAEVTWLLFAEPPGR
jgi:hypothetical protein